MSDRQKKIKPWLRFWSGGGRRGSWKERNETLTEIYQRTIKSSGTENRDVRKFRSVGYINISVLSLGTSDKFQPDIYKRLIS